MKKLTILGTLSTKGKVVLCRARGCIIRIKKDGTQVGLFSEISEHLSQKQHYVCCSCPYLRTCTPNGHPKQNKKIGKEVINWPTSKIGNEHHK